MAISRKLAKELSDLLTRAKASGLTDDEIHDRAGLASGWLSGARRGRYGPNAASWKKLERFLDRLADGDKFLKKLDEAHAKPRSGGVDQPREAESATPSVGLVLDPDGKSTTPIGQAIVKASTFRRLGKLLAMIAAAVADGQIPHAKADLLEKLVKTRASILKKEREEQATAKVRALEILTAAEVKLLDEHRAKLAGPPLKPGDYPPPPASEPKG